MIHLKIKKLWMTVLLIIGAIVLIFLFLTIRGKNHNKISDEEKEVVYETSNIGLQESNDEKDNVESETEKKIDDTKEVDDETQEVYDYDEELQRQNDEKISLVSQSDIPTVIIPKVQAKSGDKVELEVQIINNPGILGMSLTLSYDESIVKLIEIENGKAVEEALSLTYSKKLADGCVFLWDGLEILPDQIKDGELMTLKFEVLETDFVGTVPIVLIAAERGTFDNDLNNINLVVENGEIIIAK